MKSFDSKEKESFYNTCGQMAILIDGGYFLKRLRSLTKKGTTIDAPYVVKMVKILCNEHAKKLNQKIYRIFYYDCPPIEAGVHNPISKKFIKFKDTPLYKFKNELFAELKKMRKIALRLGTLNYDKNNRWTISPEKVTALLNGTIQISDLNPEKDLLLNIRQKQVDMKIGVDITSMALKQQISTIVLVAGDGDFVPASKLARREGIDFILDPIWGKIHPDLNEHIDGLYSVLFRPKADPSIEDAVS